MQLFTIGLWKLNSDGTAELDEAGERVQTYDNDDIMAFARVWTGFDRQAARGNVEARNGARSPNIIDPMRIRPAWRDVFPKSDLEGGYLGDGYALCTDLPADAFLRSGARYIYKGAISGEGASFDNIYRP